MFNFPLCKYKLLILLSLACLCPATLYASSQQTEVDWQKGIIRVVGKAEAVLLSASAQERLQYKDQEHRAWTHGRQLMEDTVRQIFAPYLQSKQGFVRWVVDPSKIKIYSRNTFYHANGSVEVLLESKFSSMLDWQQISKDRQRLPGINPGVEGYLALELEGPASPLPWFSICDNTGSILFSLIHMDPEVLQTGMMASWTKKTTGGRRPSSRLKVNQDGVCLTLKNPSLFGDELRSLAHVGKVQVYY